LPPSWIRPPPDVVASFSQIGQGALSGGGGQLKQTGNGVRGRGCQRTPLCIWAYLGVRECRFFPVSPPVFLFDWFRSRQFLRRPVDGEDRRVRETVVAILGRLNPGLRGVSGARDG